MIDYIKYTIDNKTYNLTNNGDGTWSKETTAPKVAGNYSLLLEISENGIVTFIDSSDLRYDFYLDVLARTERIVCLQNYVPDFISEISEFQTIYETENLEFDKLYAEIEKIKSDAFILTGSNDAITRIEKFVNIKGQGTLEQRKSYLMSLLQKGNKINEVKIKEITNTIAGASSIVTFLGANELDNSEPGYGLLRLQVLSPDNNKDYRYEDILRSIKPLVPSHIKLLVVKYFALWADIKLNFADWTTLSAMKDWQSVKNYIPPD